MSDRPTPQQIADYLDGATGLYAAEQFLDRLETEGYVIVHPDDVPTGAELYGITVQRFTWDKCRDLIFGDDA